jgi:adenylate kinase
MRLILIGPSGAGKGTQAKTLSNKFDIPHISTGDIFRKHIKDKTEIGIKVKAILDSGDYVSDELTTEIVKDRLSQEDCKNGFVLDGFPRTTAQASSLEKFATIDKVLYLKVTEEILIERLAGRLICRDCGAMYHITNIKPKKEDICDTCDGTLYQREDDKEEIVRERFNIFKNLTLPIINFYKDKNLLAEVNGLGDITDITNTILKELEG